MKSLTSINDLIHSWQPLRAAVSSLSSDATEFPASVEGAQGAFFSFFLKDFCTAVHLKGLQSLQYSNTSRQGPSYSSASNDFVLVVPTEFEAAALENDIRSVFPSARTYVLSSFSQLPYRPAARGSSIFGKRSGFLSLLASPSPEFGAEPHPRIFIFTQRAFISPLPAPDYMRRLSFSIKKNDRIDTVKIAQRLASLGYMRVGRVNVRGEFSLRGEVLDIFPPLDEHPTRVIFDFDEVEALRLFETDAQTTVGARDSVFIPPMREVFWDEALVRELSARLDEYQGSAVSEASFAGEPPASGDGISFCAHLPFTKDAIAEKDRILRELKLSGESEGEEFFYPLVLHSSALDYISEGSYVLVFDYARQKNAVMTINRENSGLYRKAREACPVLPPEFICKPYEQLIEKLSRCIKFKTISETPSVRFDVEMARSFFGNIKYMKDELEKLQAEDWHIFIFTDNENQGLRIKEIFKEFIYPEDASRIPVALIPQPVTEGFVIPDARILVIQENEIFGRRRYTPKTSIRAKSQAIDTFVELNSGDYVVHVNYGIGRFLGIDRVKSMGNERDYIKLEYADEEYVFVPIEQVNLVQRYIGNEGEAPRLDRIGSKAWENRKSKVQKSVEELAQKLIDLYSRRKASVGYAFPRETEWQTAFEAAFPYEDTPDQITVTEEIKADMERPVPMDRLVCGDVGYGKTEIAMRAAFKAVMGGKQVAFLAPTTILAEQHFETCVERFRNFPVKVGHLSRFVAPAEQKKLLKSLAEGEIDILVGTHRLVQKDVVFKNLGLMIIDEEQRFGVKDKERLKELKNNVDCLTMSATPIPRTLHMSLLKIRDMSLLTTPPQNRQPIETFVDEFSDDKVARAIRNEMERGGQVFYLHNRVEDLVDVKRRIENLVPECLVDFAHGQMTSAELDDIFRRFKMGGFHVLVATTIIENGIDIPNVNTIIIDRADMYGVSQLYQLRGRVGRSDRRASAYLLYPKARALSEVAMKRLQVISDFTELGSGFKIAMKDMEIRGAGNLLGRDQSGYVYAVGFDLYMRLLNEAVERLTAQKDYQQQTEVLMELDYTGFIPDTYVSNPQIKMEIYKKIAAVTTDAEFESVLSELDDRFGPVPDEVSSLLALAEIRILCKKLCIQSLKESEGEVRLDFASVSGISVDRIMRLIRDNPGTIRLVPAANAIFIKLGKIGLREKSEFIREKLSQLVA